MTTTDPNLIEKLGFLEALEIMEMVDCRRLRIIVHVIVRAIDCTSGGRSGCESTLAQPSGQQRRIEQLPRGSLLLINLIFFYSFAPLRHQHLKILPNGRLVSFVFDVGRDIASA